MTVDHASVAAIVEYLTDTTDDVYELLPGDPAEDCPTVYYYDLDSGSHVFVEWAGEKGWILTWQCSPGLPTSAKLPTPDPADAVKTAETIARVRSGEIDEFRRVA